MFSQSVFVFVTVCLDFYMFLEAACRELFVYVECLLRNVTFFKKVLAQRVNCLCNEFAQIVIYFGR